MRVVNCLIAMIMSLTAPALADESKPPKVAVLDLQAQGVAEDAVKTLTGVLLSGLTEGGGIDLLSKADLGSMLSLEQTKLLFKLSHNKTFLGSVNELVLITVYTFIYRLSKIF